MTDEALALLVAAKQNRQTAVSTFAVCRAERIQASQPGRERWARAVRQTIDDETDELVARYGRAILAAAHEEIRLVDPVALELEPLHLVDFDAIRARTDQIGGFTMARGVFDVLQRALPGDAFRGPMSALNVRVELRDATRLLPADATENDIVAMAQERVTRTTLHEWAHVVAEKAAGWAIDCALVLSHPERIEAVALALETPRSLGLASGPSGSRRWRRCQIRPRLHPHLPSRPPDAGRLSPMP